MTAARPTPPSPKIAADSPVGTPAVSITAPTPVSTAQPNRAAVSNGMSGATTTTERRETTA